MQAPLFDVKNKLSEYVRRVESGETVELTKHGETTAVLIGADEYRELTERDTTFKILYETWLREYPAAGTPDAEFPYDTIRSKETGDSSRSSIW
jgi:prevent-host-death family protein